MGGVTFSTKLDRSEIIDCGNGVTVERHQGGEDFKLSIRGHETSFARGALEQLARAIDHLTINFPRND
jgi:hypothetical protein